MISTIIIDDEHLARKTLKTLLGHIAPEIKIIGEADSVDSAIELIWSHNPQLIFLDIDLSDGSGFNVLERIPNNKTDVIFVTAYDDFAIQAFKVNAIDYILKPIDRNRLYEAVSRIREKLEAGQKHDAPDKIKETRSEKLAINESDGIRFVDVMDILRCKSDGNYTELFLNNGDRITSSRTLKEYTTVLEPFGFIRTHQSHLINSMGIKKIYRQDGLSVELNNGVVVPVSRRRKDELFKQVKKMGI